MARLRPTLFDAVPDDPPTEPFEPDAGPTRGPPESPAPSVPPRFAAGEKGKARALLAAVRTLHTLERETRPPTADEQQALADFPGFGPVALSLFPDPTTGRYKDAGWQALGDELQALLSPEEYAAARRSTFTAFYTSPVVIRAVYAALDRLGVPPDARLLEPGCGSGHFLALAPAGTHATGVELDPTSARIAQARHPHHTIRAGDFRDTVLPAAFDAAVGNVPFADLRTEYAGQKLALHDLFLVKALDALAPGGVLAAVTSRYTLDKQNSAARELMGERADFLGAVRLPSDAFRAEGTAVVTDLVFFRKRAPGEVAAHVSGDWLGTAPLELDGATVAVNGYFLSHPDMVLGNWSRQDTLYGGEGLSVTPTGELAEQLPAAVARLPHLPRRERAASSQADTPRPEPDSPPDSLPEAEGSFFVGSDRRIYQRRDGRAEPVSYGGRELTATGTLVGKRLAALVGLRDLARTVLRAQTDGWAEDRRQAARRDLNHAYDRFALAYGPVNATTFSETADGTVVRRTPNLVKFREDPDAMLVMALEEYDEATGKAAKAPVMLRDVVGPTPPVTRVDSAEAGLLVSLDRTGRVDLPLIGELYGRPEAEVLRELGDLVYRDPATGTWETADAYLSGNVRVKLAQAEAAGAGFIRNADALRTVQPEDVLPGDIDANLGAPWIPASDIQQFAADLFRVPPASVQVAHLPADAVWSVEGDFSAQRSVAATSEFGTPRANGLWLLEQALNLKTPTVYDPDGDSRVVNPEATLAARDKQAAIKDRFRQWVFADPERTERLVRAYNDAYNATRLGQFDGSHLRFPGMSAGVTLRQHQADAAWRCVSGGNTLLAHCVGAGKTYTMAAAGMKLRQAGLARKPMYVVPNHLLEQFAREFLHLYPTAKLLVAGKDDLTKDRRKLLTAQIATGDWDGIVVTHSSFERIGLSQQFQADFLRDQIAEYDRLLADRACARPGAAQRNVIKTIEKQKARREDKLKELLAADKKDDGLVFDELGVDHLFIDEAHAFKNLETPTKMERVAGVQTGGSERAFDLLMKCQYLHRKNPVRGVTFATGTPVSNTMVELYTLQRYLDPDGLAAAGIAHFDAWAAAFGEVVDAMEVAPDGSSLRPRSRFAKFVNLPELQQMFRAFADVQTADMLDLPRPALAGGKAQVVACPMSDAQAALQRGLVERYEKLRSERIDPREDNALAVTTDGRKLALDPRLLDPAAPDDPASKLNALVETVHRVWRDSTPTKGTQLVFCDLGVRPTAWGFSVYDEVVRKLTARGIPAGEIACVGEAESDAKKQALFERVRAGRVRVLLGSTAKMGAGTNVQTRLVALHHLDAPWKPAEVEQREGRILRQGNTNAEVAVYRYVTEGSFDAYLWQALETKAKFIGQVMTGQSAARRAGDVGEQTLSYAEVKALASGNPAVLTLAEADAEVQRLGVLKRSHADEQYLARRAVRDLPGEIERLDTRLAAMEEDRATAEANRHAPLVIGKRSVPADDLMATVGEVLDRLPDDPVRMKRQDIGTFRGLALAVERHPGGATDVRLSGAAARGVTLSRDAHGPRAVLNAATRIADGYAEACDRTRAEADVCRTQLADHQRRLGAVFPHAGRLDELVKLRDQLRQALSVPSLGVNPAADDGSPPPPTASELSDRIKTLLAAPRPEGEGAKKVHSPTWAERTARRSGVGNGQGPGA